MHRSSRRGGNALLLAPALDDDAEDGVFGTLTESPSETNLLVVSYLDGPDEWLPDLRAYAETLPADVGFVRVGETTRSAATATANVAPDSRFPAVNAVSDPADLTGLGILVSEYFERWAETDRRTVLYVDSVTALLQFVELDQAYRFLHVLGGRVRSVDGTAYYRLDPDAHESRTLAVLRNLMDSVVDLTPDAEADASNRNSDQSKQTATDRYASSID